MVSITPEGAEAIARAMGSEARYEMLDILYRLHGPRVDKWPEHPRVLHTALVDVNLRTGVPPSAVYPPGSIKD